MSHGPYFRVVCSEMALKILDEFWSGRASEHEYHHVLKPAAARLFKIQLDDLRKS